MTIARLHTLLRLIDFRLTYLQKPENKNPQEELSEAVDLIKFRIRVQEIINLRQQKGC